MICLDASVCAKLVLKEVRSDIARNLVNSAITAGQPIIAPPLLPIEMANILHQQWRRNPGSMPEAATARFTDFTALPITVINLPGLHELAMDIAQVCNLSATYDAHYLALTALMECEFWTDDRRLLQRLAGQLAFVRWLGDFVPPLAT